MEFGLIHGKHPVDPLDKPRDALSLHLRERRAHDGCSAPVHGQQLAAGIEDEQRIGCRFHHAAKKFPAFAELIDKEVEPVDRAGY